MCAVDNVGPTDISCARTRKARKSWVCEECARIIPRGEAYLCVSGLAEGCWFRYRVCRHCEAVAEWMSTVCGGYLFGDLHDELVEHRGDGYRSDGMDELIAGIARRWNSGADPVPDKNQVHDLAVAMMREKVVTS